MMFDTNLNDKIFLMPLISNWVYNWSYCCWWDAFKAYDIYNAIPLDAFEYFSHILQC